MPWLLDPNAPFEALWFIQCALTLLLGVVALGATVVGYIGGSPLHIFERTLMGIAALLLIIPGTTTDIMGAVLLTFLFVKQVLKKRWGEKQSGLFSGSLWWRVSGLWTYPEIWSGKIWEKYWGSIKILEFR